ncbi:D-amino acid aminotransferase [Thiohalospira sp.]|uniref:D-amino acid aminotransferase n=1 Tax=Thiohalospira sp. TaxID=3080549 RepID=UPI00397F6C32
MAEPTVYLNGLYLPESEACVPILDRGFIFGDGVYEVLPVYAGEPFRLAPHLERLERSLRLTAMDNPHGRAGWERVIREVIHRNGGGDQSVYLQITRGVARRDHAFPAETPPTALVMSSPLIPPAAEELARGSTVITRPDPRWLHCDIKTTSLLPNVLLRQEAQEAGADEVILIRDGVVTEAATANLFLVREGRLLTPQQGPHLLPGITRDLVLEIAAAEGIPAGEAALDRRDLATTEEIWLTSSTREIRPVTRVDGRPVGNGEAGPLWQRLHAAYQACKDRIRAGEAG